MTSTERSPLGLVGILAMLIIMGLAGGLYWNQNRVMTIRYDQVEQLADSLLSVKLQLEGDIRSLKSQLDEAHDEKDYLTGRIDNLHQQLTQRDNVLDQLRQTAANRTSTVQHLNQIVASLTTQRDSLTNQMEATRDKIGWMTASNELVVQQNKDLQNTVEKLNTSLLTKVPHSFITGDAFLVEASKANGKETAKANKVHTLTISLNVPVELQLAGKQDVYLSLTDANQKPMIPPIRMATITLPAINEVIPVHAQQAVNFTQSTQRISFQLDPGIHIKPGIYRASVYTKDQYLGAVEFRFRDSIWFF